MSRPEQGGRCVVDDVPGQDSRAAAGPATLPHRVVPTVFPSLTGRLYEAGPEKALLFSTANVYPDPAGDARLRTLVAGPMSWDRALALAQVHGVMGLLRRRLYACDASEAVPEDARHTLNAWHSAQRIKHFTRAQQLADVLAAAAAHGIDPVLLKGSALAATAYPDPGLRPMADIDLLVAREHVATMSALLEQQGYERREDLYYGPEFNSSRGYHVMYADPANLRMPIEVHWDLANQLERHHRLTAAAVRQHLTRARVVPLSGAAVPEAWVFAPHVQLVYVAVHAATGLHAFGQLKWLADVAAIAGAPNAPDWPAVVRFAGDVRARTATYVALALARDLLSADVPAAALAELRPPPRVLWTLDRRLNPASILDATTEERRSVVKYFTVDSRTTRVRLLREHLLPPPDALRTFYPGLQGGGLLPAYAWHVATLGYTAVRKVGALLSGRAISRRA
jgi:Uncharacterised nucleotidyltransferase